ncbi:MAG: acetyl-CoA carboxylase [Armatimonadota bacterium]|nr:acetyl-CoA carboxylase [Armatimonadota bacterium]MCX7776637.1 acetyl-CoA carboxylase [Armatimonadota bacterium]MDW8025220.1 acetyl-CoA carboxylase [Armatimonadota bacterium]
MVGKRLMQSQNENKGMGNKREGNKPDEIEQVHRLLQLMKEFALSEVIIETSDFMVCLRRGITTQSELRRARRQVEVHGIPVSLTHVSVPVFQAEPPEELHYISSPLTGIFYRRPAPNEPPFVEVGRRVEVGQVVALVEAMKVFNEVFSDVDGIVVEIRAQDGQLVHQGDTIMVMKRVESPG